MSFFKKFTDEFKDLKLGGKDKPAESAPAPPPADTTRGYGDSYGGGQQYPPPQQHDQYSSYGQQQSQFGGGPPPSQYGHQQYPPFQGQNQYTHSQNQSYGQQYGAPQQYSSPPVPQPPRWIQQFDQASQRHYYVETTGRSQWDPPQDSQGGQRGIGGEAGGFYNQYAGAMPTQGHGGASEYAHQENAKDYYGKSEKKEKGHDTRNMLLAGGAGLAVGGLAVAALSGDDSDDEHRAAPAAAPYAGDSYGYGTPAPPPAHDSDAESLHEAQKDYNEAVEAAADSDASSDELEDLQEAREELEEEREEYYED